MQEVFEPINYVLPMALLVASVMIIMNKPCCLKAGN